MLWFARASRGGALVLSLLIVAGGGCGSAPRFEQRHLTGEALGTTYNVKLSGPPISDEATAAAGEIVTRELAEVDSRMSTYKSDSELSRLNRADPSVPIKVSSELAQILVAARQIGAATDGAFDITVGPLVNAWGFGPAGKPKSIPSEAELEELRRITGWDKIEIDESEPAVRKKVTGVYCDLSGIAKGYAVDQVSDALLDAGFANHMVEVGGEVRVRGINQTGAPWVIGIESPLVSRHDLQRALRMRDLAMATSGDYRNFYEVDGVRYSHIIDPRTGKPIRHRLASVSVVDQFCTQVDGFATALLVLGETDGYKAAVANGLAALFLIRDRDGSFEERATPRFRTLFGESGHEGEQP